MPKHIPQLHNEEWLQNIYKTRNTWEIAELLHCTQSAVWGALKRHNIPVRLPGRPLGPEELRNKDWLSQKYIEENLTTHEIAAILGCRQPTVYKWMIRHGIALRRQVRRRKSNKYAAILHPKTRKIILKHRWIMEEHLGRELLPSENVHHIDGNPENNDLSNLIILTKSAHHRLHGKDTKKHMQKYDYMRFQHLCTRCGQSFHGGNRAKRCPSCRSARH